MKLTQAFADGQRNKIQFIEFVEFVEFVEFF